MCLARDVLVMMEPWLGTAHENVRSASECAKAPRLLLCKLEWSPELLEIERRHR